MATRGERLTGLDASFLHLETQSSHMQRRWGDAVRRLAARARRAGRRDRGAAAPRAALPAEARLRPAGPGPPRWVDDPHLNLHYHVRTTALPAPGSEDQLKALAGRVFSQKLDRDKPLWELWVVEGLDGGERFAVLSKTHHALVDGISGVEHHERAVRHLARAGDAPGPGQALAPAPLPSRMQLLPRRSSSARPSPPRSCAGSEPRSGRRGESPARRGRAGRSRSDGLGRHQPRPFLALQLPIGPHRASRGCACRSPTSRRPRTRSGHRQRRDARDRDGRPGARPASPRHRRARARAEVDGPREHALRRGARRARQPGHGDDGPAAGGRRGPGRPLRGDQHRDGEAQGGWPGVGAR